MRKIPQTATPATRHLVAGRAALDRAAQALDRALRAGEISEYEHHRLARQVWSVGDAVTRTVRDREADRAAAKTAKCFWCGERIVQARGGEWVKWGRSDTYCGWRRRRDPQYPERPAVHAPQGEGDRWRQWGEQLDAPPARRRHGV